VIRLQRRIANLRSEASGFSLVELIVAMGIFAIFMAIFMSAMVNLTRGATRAQLTAESSTSVLRVFQNLDRQVRYADAINLPGPAAGSSGARYVEFRTSEPSASGADISWCTQWRFLPAERRIETRRWHESTPGSTTTGWSTKAINVVDQGGAGYPFTMLPAETTGGPTKQRLVLTLSAGNESMGAGAATTTTYVARNSSIQSVSNSMNPADLVCNRTGLRP
jgi:prepilin-type N-terminal cleavage/methylation domain-containing protein